MTIKAIETKYNGYRFRSRLEARWAVFFDALDIRYEYEHEGFDLGELGWYLPDFWLPDFKWGGRTGAWVEIKPTAGESKKIRALSNHPNMTMLIYGDPYIFDKNKRGILYFLSKTDKSNLGWWGLCPHCSNLNIMMVVQNNPNNYINVCSVCDDWSEYERNEQELKRILSGMEKIASRLPHATTICHLAKRITRLRNAYRAARSARFEHGESGATL